MSTGQATTCYNCDMDTYSPARGATACTLSTKQGYFSRTGASACVQCSVVPLEHSVSHAQPACTTTSQAQSRARTARRPTLPSRRAAVHAASARRASLLSAPLSAATACQVCGGCLYVQRLYVERLHVRRVVVVCMCSNCMPGAWGLSVCAVTACQVRGGCLYVK